MNSYGIIDYSLLDLGLIDDPAFIDSFSRGNRDREEEEESLLKLSSSILKDIKRNQSPPKNHRHDGTSPLPLGMDWSPAHWNGPDTIWPQESHAGWSYCVLVPSWTILSESGVSDPVVFYRVQVGLRSPEGVTTMRGVLKRFSDFLKLSTNLKRSFRTKKLPPPPPKGLLRTKSDAHLEERRGSLEDWMAKILSDIDFSRSAPMACFLELEAAARAHFRESSHHVPNINRCNGGSSSDLLSSHSGGSVSPSTSALASNYNDEPTCDTPDIGPGASNIVSQIHERNVDSCGVKISPIVGPVADLPAEESHTCKRSATPVENSNLSKAHLEKHSESFESPEDLNTFLTSDFQFSDDGKTEVENLIARLNQEFAIKQYLTTKVKDLQAELEFTNKSLKENLEQAILTERKKYTQLEWDMEELRRKYMEMETALVAGQDGKAQHEATETSIIQESVALQEELDSAKKQLINLQKCHEESDLKSKSDVELLEREVKSLRSSHSELRQELDRLVKEKTEFEERLLMEKQKKERMDVANDKLLHECKILRSRLEECSVDFLIDEENKVKLDAYSPSDVLDILATSENHVSLLLAEARLLAKDVQGPLVADTLKEDDELTETDDELRKMIVDIFIDNTMLRKRVNSTIHCTLRDTHGSV